MAGSGSSANMSTNATREGGLVSTSFPSTLDEKDVKTVVNHFAAGLSTQATQAGNHSLDVGQYFVTTLRSGVRLSPYYLGKAGVIRDAATDEELSIFMGTHSNVASIIATAVVDQGTMIGRIL